MRLSRSLASVTAAVCLVMSPPYDAMPHTRVQAREAAPPEPFGASCRSRVAGSRVISYCHNPYPRTDGVRLHIECARWWDLDSDGPEVEAGLAADRTADRTVLEGGPLGVDQPPEAGAVNRPGRHRNG